jgi:hypothetical protein
VTFERPATLITRSLPAARSDAWRVRRIAAWARSREASAAAGYDFLGNKAGPVVNAAVGNLQFRTLCNGVLAPDGSYLEFVTDLAGINPDGTPSSPLASFDWTDAFNGTVGGIATTASNLPADPDSGSGGITIVSIDGVPVPEPSSLLLLAQPALILIAFALFRTGRGKSGVSAILP